MPPAALSRAGSGLLRAVGRPLLRSRAGRPPLAPWAAPPRPARPGARPAPSAEPPGAPPPATPARPGADVLVLGIESSCDDTGAAVVTGDGRLLGEAIAHQHEVHRPFGGVVPMLAREAHERAIDRVVEEALARAGVAPADLSAVAVTIGPGLSLCLGVGVRKARQLSARYGLPTVPVHHMEAHALVARMPRLGEAAGGPAAAGPPTDVPYPFLCALVSGGHNLLLLVRGLGDYTVLGSTLDDALGEAFDKVARLLGLPLEPSGGASVEAAAGRGDAGRYEFTMPLRHKPSADFSFSGLKTAVRLAAEEALPAEGDAAAWAALTPEQERARCDIAAGFQDTATRHLCKRIERGAQWAREAEPGLDTLVLAGGVAANRTVRARLQETCEELGLAMLVPPPRYCTDNGVMVAWAGVERLAGGFVEPPAPAEEYAEGEWVDMRPRWPLGARHERATGVVRSTKKKKLHKDLTTCTREWVAEAGEAASSLGLAGMPGGGGAAAAAGCGEAEWAALAARVAEVRAERALTGAEEAAWGRLAALRAAFRGPRGAPPA